MHSGGAPAAELIGEVFRHSEREERCVEGLNAYIYVPCEALIVSAFCGWMERSDFDLLEQTLGVDAAYPRFTSVLDLSAYVGCAPREYGRFFRAAQTYAERQRDRLILSACVLPTAAVLRFAVRGGALMTHFPWTQRFVGSEAEAVDAACAAAPIQAPHHALLAPDRAKLVGHMQTLRHRLLRDARLFLELTRSENRVALLVAKGLTDADIAAALAISEATVGTHLHRVYRKLGVHTRVELLAMVQERRSAI